MTKMVKRLAALIMSTYVNTNTFCAVCNKRICTGEPCDGC